MLQIPLWQSFVTTTMVLKKTLILVLGTYIATWAEDVKKYITYQMGVFQ